MNESENVTTQQANHLLVTKNPPRFAAFRWTGENITEACKFFDGPVQLIQEPMWPQACLQLPGSGEVVRAGWWIVRERHSGDDGPQYVVCNPWQFDAWYTVAPDDD